MYQVTATNTQTPIKLESSKVNQNNVRKINYHGEDVWLIDADKIYIHISDDGDFKKTYTMIDMSFVGVAKSVLGLFYRPLHYSL